MDISGLSVFSGKTDYEGPSILAPNCIVVTL